MIFFITEEHTFTFCICIAVEIPDKDYIKQVLTNITKEEMKHVVRFLRKGLNIG